MWKSRIVHPHTSSCHVVTLTFISWWISTKLQTINAFLIHHKILHLKWWKISLLNINKQICTFTSSTVRLLAFAHTNILTFNAMCSWCKYTVPCECIHYCVQNAIKLSYTTCKTIQTIHKLSAWHYMCFELLFCEKCKCKIVTRKAYSHLKFEYKNCLPKCSLLMLSRKICIIWKKKMLNTHANQEL